MFSFLLEHIDTSLMPAALKRSGEEDINISASILGADELRTEAYNIRIVVTT